MNRPAGFVSVNFRLAGKLLFILGVLGLLAVGVDALTGWFGLPKVVFLVSAGWIPIVGCGTTNSGC
jgi:hypothetical protein